MDDEDYFAPRITKWCFEPFYPVRDDLPGDAVFIRNWQTLMGGANPEHDTWFVENEGDTFPILALFHDIPDAHDTRVASSLIHWLSTHLGQNFLDECHHMKPKFEAAMPYDTDKLYLANWALKNGIVPQSIYGAPPRLRLMDEAPTARDLVTMERVMMWLGTETGQTFLDKCQHDLRQEYNRRDEARRAAVIARRGGAAL